MSDNEKEEVINYKLSRANECLTEAEFLLKNNFLNTAVNRLYYACFYAVSALLYDNGIKAKTHSGVIQMLSLHFISTGMVSKESGKFYSEIFDLRQESDYENFIEFDENEVAVLFLPAKKMITEIKQLLAK